MITAVIGLILLTVASIYRSRRLRMDCCLAICLLRSCTNQRLINDSVYNFVRGDQCPWCPVVDCSLGYNMRNDLYIRRVIRTLMALPEPSEMNCYQCRLEHFRSCLDFLLSATKTYWVSGICGDDCDGEILGRRQDRTHFHLPHWSMISANQVCMSCECTHE